jgi:cytochrome c oxidase subunit 1
LVFLYNFFSSSIFYGKKSVQNPWRLQWPREWANDYSNPEHEEDFVPQNVPMKPGESLF